MCKFNPLAYDCPSNDTVSNCYLTFPYDVPQSFQILYLTPIYTINEHLLCLTKMYHNFNRYISVIHD